MNIAINNISILEAQAVIVPVFAESEEVSLEYVSDIYQYIRSRKQFKGEQGEIFTTVKFEENLAQDIIFAGLGKEEEINGEKIRTALAKAVKKARELKAEKVYVNFINTEKLCYGAVVKAMVEGLKYGDYKFDWYKTDRKEQAELNIGFGNVSEEKYKDTEDYIREGEAVAEAALLARDLVNEPANVIYPETLAEEVLEHGKKYGFEVEVLDELQIEDLEMDAFLSVAQGSDKAPRVIIMRYFGDAENKSEILGLVGKGLTYDSGGYSIKPTDGMVAMKSDMGGAAAVIGAMSAIAQRKLKINVVAVVAACENMISGGAYKPGDIIGSMSGKTIEVLNTDAEGRLTLADAVFYIVEKEKVSRVIDVATLTGAALVALGTTTTAVVTNNDEFYSELETASRKAGEKVWLLPAFDEYKKMLKSDIADLKNLGGRFAGTITAGLFIGEFVLERPWLHLDIAGTAWTDAERDYYSKGGTGAGVRTLYYLAKKASRK